MDNQIIENQNNKENSGKNSGIMKKVGFLVFIVATGLVTYRLKTIIQTNINSSNTDSNIPLSGLDNEPVVNNKKYKDGTYSAIGNYVSPNGPESVNVTLVLKDDVVTSTTFKGNGTHATTMKMQGLFSQGFNTLVVGKKLDEVSLTVVNGSSLTPKGFMDALSKIKLEATS